MQEKTWVLFDIEIVVKKRRKDVVSATLFPEQILDAFPALYPTGTSQFYAIAGCTSLIPLTKQEQDILAHAKQKGEIVDYQVVERIETPDYQVRVQEEKHSV